MNQISTHTSRVGCDLHILLLQCRRRQFLLTHPVWDVTLSASAITCLPQFLLTHPVWDVTFDSKREMHRYLISTHTSRVGCDDEKL